MLLKIPIIYKKKDSNKNCSEFNFLQKTQWTHMSISRMSGPRGLHRLPCLKYWNGKIEKIHFRTEHAAKNTRYIKKTFK